jgi:hypothetical protein
MALHEVEGPAGAPWERPIHGTVDRLVVESDVLAGNPLGDPARRPLYVYRPPGVEPDHPRGLPSVYVIMGYTGQLDMWLNRTPLEPAMVERVDAMFAAGECPDAIVAFVDCWTSYGGSQFLNSSSLGRYQDYLCDEVVAFVDERYRTIADAAHRGIAGKSSGGYGAMVTPMLRPDLFGGLVTHAGDALFEACYLPDFRDAARALREEYDGSFDAYWTDVRSRPGRSKRSDGVLLNVWCMAACYSADPDGTVRVPFNASTGRLDQALWERWLAWDPVRMAAGHADALGGMRAIWIDAGRSDDFYLDLGAIAFRDELTALGIGEGVVRFELFDGTHAGLEWRYPGAVGWLAERLS